MKVSTILDHIESGNMALPEFQRGYVWNRGQVRDLMDSMYRKHPVGSLLVWVTETESITRRGDAPLPPGTVRLILDGQQRMTSLYGVVRGKPPAFFEGDQSTFTGLHFNIDTEAFEFYGPVRMRDNPRWISVTELIKNGIAPFTISLSQNPDLAPDINKYINRMNAVANIPDIDLHIDEVTGADKE